MRIPNIQNYNNYNYQYTHTNPAFTSHYIKYKEVYKPGTVGNRLEDLLYTNSTAMFRRNEGQANTWRESTKLVYEVFKDIEDFKMTILGCGCGKEPLTWRIALINDCGYDFAQKCTPIKAVDIDSEAIAKAESDYINLSLEEMIVIDKYTNGNFDKYLLSPYAYDRYSIRKWKINHILSSGIEYVLGDIFDEYKKITPDNNVISAKDFWLYFDLDKRKELADGLASKVGKRSLVFIGDADREDIIRHAPADEFLINAGFKPSKTVDYAYKTPDLPDYL